MSDATAQTRSLLLVEDEPAARRALAAILRHEGWRVVAVDTAADALAVLETDPPPDAVLLDVMLPDADGSVVLAHVRRRGLPSRVVVTTGCDAGDPRMAAVRALRPDAVITKPVQLAELYCFLKHEPRC